MKKFNQITEAQMSKMNGGFVVAGISAVVSIVGGLGIIASSAVAASGVKPK